MSEAAASISIKYLLAVDGQQTGPFTIQELQQLLAEGKATRTSQVWAEGMPEWVSLQSLPGMPPPIIVTSSPNNTAMKATDESSEGMGTAALALPVVSGLAMLVSTPNQTSSIEALTILVTACLIAADAHRLGAGRATDVNAAGRVREGATTWFFSSLLLWVVAFPLWFSRRASYGAKKNIGAALGAAAIFIGCAVIAASGSAVALRESAELRLVKNGSLAACPNRTVQQDVNNFFGSPNWESGQSAAGVKFVNVSGEMTYMNKPVTGVVQFLIEGNSFRYRSFEINGVPQNNLVAMGLINKLCGK